MLDWAFAAARTASVANELLINRIDPHTISSPSTLARTVIIVQFTVDV